MTLRLSRRFQLLAMAVALLAAAFASVTPTPAAAKRSVPQPPILVKLHQTSGSALPYFRLRARPDSVVKAGSLELRNPTGRPLKVRLDPVNGTTTSTLGSAYGTRNDPPLGATTWTDLGVRQVLVPAHGSTRVPVSLRVPQSAAAGDYLSGISVEVSGQKPTVSTGHGLAIGQITRYAIGVEVSLPGPRNPQILLTAASVQRQPAGVVFNVRARNSGNVTLTNVRGRVVVTNGSHVVARLPIGPGTFVSGTTIEYPIAGRSEQPAEGTHYRVRAIATYRGGRATLDREVTFGHAASVRQGDFGGPGPSRRGLPSWAIPAIAGAAALLLLIAGVVAVRARRRRRRNLPDVARVLRGHLESAGRHGEAVSVIFVPSAPNGTGRRIRRMVRSRLHRSDLTCRLGEHGILVIAPGARRPTVNGLAVDIATALRRTAPRTVTENIGVATATNGETAGELISEASRSYRMSVAGRD